MKKKLIVGICSVPFIILILVFANTAVRGKAALKIKSLSVSKEEYEFLSTCATPYTELALKDRPEDEGMNKVLVLKSEQLLLQKLKIMKDPTYENFKEMLQKENESRKIKKEKSEVIYGPEQFEAKVFYDYLLSEYRDKAIKVLGSQEKYENRLKEAIEHSYQLSK